MAWLDEQLAAKDLVDEWHEACQQIAATPAHGNKTVHPVWRIKDLRSHDQHWHGGSLIEWRDGRAAEADLPPGRVLPNALIPVIAKQQPGNFGLRRHATERAVLRAHGEDLIDFINKTAMVTYRSPSGRQAESALLSVIAAKREECRKVGAPSRQARSEPAGHPAGPGGYPHCAANRRTT